MILHAFAIKYTAPTQNKNIYISEALLAVTTNLLLSKKPAHV